LRPNSRSADGAVDDFAGSKQPITIGLDCSRDGYRRCGALPPHLSSGPLARSNRIHESK